MVTLFVSFFIVFFSPACIALSLVSDGIDRFVRVVNWQLVSLSSRAENENELRWR
jgi:hypothetical protein